MADSKRRRIKIIWTKRAGYSSEYKQQVGYAFARSSSPNGRCRCAYLDTNAFNGIGLDAEGSGETVGHKAVDGVIGATEKHA